MIPTWKSGHEFEVALEGKMEEKALRYLSAADFNPVQPNYAATVMLLRDTINNPKRTADGESDIEVFMLRRAETMAFVPTAVVFPGGRVDMRDADLRLPWAGPSSEDWAHRFNCEEELARCIVVAAAREVFEECGVLLAGKDASSVIGDLSNPVWEDARKELAGHTKSFAEILVENDLVLRSDLLSFRSRWLTPEFESRRYDTFFFAALLPEGQTPDDRTSEATIADWVKPEWAFQQAHEGKILLLAPTRYNLSCIAQANDAQSFVEEIPKVERILLQPHQKDDGTVVVRCVLP